MVRTRTALLTIGGLLAGFAGLRMAGRLPRLEPRATSRALGDTADTTLGRSAARQCAAHPGLSGVQLLTDAPDAFAARVLLASAAERSIDLQYYIWHGDRSGTLLLEALHEAAERGVRVRMLLDDNGIVGLDTVLAALDDHPNIEVRLFNPFAIRWPKPIGYLSDFSRLNRRMHNKSFTADNQATIIGGRNIGDEYFGVGDGGLFADLDVLAIGPIVRDVSADFDRYWTSMSAYPAAHILPRVGESHRARLAATASIVERDSTASKYVAALRDLPLIRQLMEGSEDLEWAKVRMISDDPAKALGRAAPEMRLSGKLEGAIGTPQRSLSVISGYFVPGKQGIAEFRRLAEGSVAISILTNAYEATDVGVVHAGYAPCRPALLEAGIRLFEMHKATRAAPASKERRHASRLGIGSSLRGSGTGSMAALRSGASMLHAKTFAVDRKRLFIGSFNFDPRSAELNTELGFVIESPRLAAQVADAFEDAIPRHAYEVASGDDGALRWIERRGSGDIVHAREPGIGAAEHLAVDVLAKLPVQWLL
ncbi:MAG: phospholipase D family protein [Sphingobium sp.]|uniref:phospholipase D family protein n=1 Tax=Sphingobium sp. TaxID=1912891 RepID=UPI0029B52D78|nr:phospholipase D family protein [Sphingobium sp.]MDX3911412.1 phospholipase D family protein [Sphingobium sp.]